MSEATCAIDGCEAPGNKRGWCNRHYLRWYRHGDAEYERTVHRVCVVDGCEKIPKSVGVGLCEMHRGRVRRHGDPHKVLPRRRPTASYNTAHYWVRSDRGSARNHMCVDCGTPAHQWSYNHGDPAQLLSPEGFPYSLDASFYEPRCVPCHVVFDQPDRYAAG